jgi:2-dehydropantoate 2-reductase
MKTVFIVGADVGRRTGCALTQRPQDRRTAKPKPGAFKTPLVQEVQAGRAIGLDAFVGAVHELGQRPGLLPPGSGALPGLAWRLARVRGPSSAG